MTEKTYTIIVHQLGREDMVRTGVDKLNAIIIPAEMELKWPRAFKNGLMSIEVIQEENEAKAMSKEEYMALKKKALDERAEKEKEKMRIDDMARKEDIDKLVDYISRKILSFNDNCAWVNKTYERRNLGFNGIINETVEALSLKFPFLKFTINFVNRGDNCIDDGHVGKYDSDGCVIFWSEK